MPNGKVKAASKYPGELQTACWKLAQGKIGDYALIFRGQTPREVRRTTVKLSAMRKSFAKYPIDPLSQAMQGIYFRVKTIATAVGQDVYIVRVEPLDRLFGILQKGVEND